MKKSILKTIALLTSFAIVACSQDIIVENTQTINDGDAINKICITGQDFQIADDTRSSVTIGESGASFAWDEDDVIGIFPDKGDQVSFAMDEGAGTQTATFTGGGWALKSSAKYAAYYPHVYENRDLTKIPVSYVGQTQNGNGNTEHIGAYDFMAANVTTPSNGAVAFDMQHLGALVQLTVNVAEPSKLIRVTLDADIDFVQTGTIDLSAETPAINAKSSSKSLRIGLSNIVTTKPFEEVTIYFMMAPIDLTNKKLKAVIEKDNYYYQEIELTGKKFEAGKAYRLAANMVSEEKSPIVIDVATAGTFESIIYNEYYSSCYDLTSLKVTGNLNGSDIRFLRKMTGRKEDGTETSGKLKHLDLTEANIVSGGDYYYMPKSGTKYYTENNVAGDYMFYFCNLETIKFPTAITKLGNSVCSHLPQPDGNENVEDGHIGTFTSIIIPTGVTAIGNYAFAWNQNLASIELPNTLKEMGYHTFYRCDALTTINIPNSVEKDSGYTFMWCSGLRNVHISENAKYTVIGGWSFLGCNSLTTLTVPANITTISYQAFGNEYTPSALKEIHLKSTTPPSMLYDYELSESGLPSNCKIYVPIGSYSAYKASKTFKDYTIIEE
jgi:hypothetical protein